MFLVDYGYAGTIDPLDEHWESTQADTLDEAATLLVSMNPDLWEVSDANGADCSLEVKRRIKAIRQSQSPSPAPSA